MGLRTSHLSEMFFSDCHVSADALLGEPGGGMAIFNTSMRWERSLILAAAVGTMRRQLERCVASLANAKAVQGTDRAPFKPSLTPWQTCGYACRPPI